MNKCPLEFRTAVLQAKDFIQENRRKNGHDLATTEGYKSYLADSVGRLAAYSSLRGFSGNILSGGAGEFCAEKAQDAWDNNVDCLLAEAKADVEMFQVLLLGIASVVEKGAELHPKLRKWLAQFLRGKISTPPRPKGRAESVGLHNIIAHAVVDLVESGMKPMRNDQGPPFSACDAVADALAELSLSPITFFGVKRIWVQLDKSLWI